jgi:hypothetical protein
MCNCNQQRTIYSAANNQSQKNSIKVVLIKNTPLTLNGNITGRMYIFRNLNDVVWVDKRDAIDMKNKEELQVFF